MATYLIKRHGSNAANQSMTPVMAVGFVEARDRDEARSKAADRWTCYNNQCFEAIPAAKARKADLDEANECEQQEADPFFDAAPYHASTD